MPLGLHQNFPKNSCHRRKPTRTAIFFDLWNISFRKTKKTPQTNGLRVNSFGTLVNCPTLSGLGPSPRSGEGATCIPLSTPAWFSFSKGWFSASIGLRGVAVSFREGRPFYSFFQGQSRSSSTSLYRLPCYGPFSKIARLGSVSLKDIPTNAARVDFFVADMKDGKKRQHEQKIGWWKFLSSSQT